MRQAREQVEPDVLGILEVIPEGVRVQERAALDPVLVLRVHLEDFGAGVRGQGATEETVGLASDRIEGDLVGERELALRIPATDMLAVGSAGLRKAIIEDASAGSADPVQHPVEDRLPALAFVEAEIQEVAQEARRLREAVRINELRVSGQRVGSAAVVRRSVTQKRGEIS